MLESPVQVITAGGAAASKPKSSKSPKYNNHVDKSKMIKHEVSPLEVVPLDDDDDDLDGSDDMEHDETNDTSAAHSKSSSHSQSSKSSSQKRNLSLSSSGVDSLTDKAMEDDAPHLRSERAQRMHDYFWLFVCFLGIMVSFVLYGLLLEYTTSGGRKLHELSFLFVTSSLYTCTAAAGRYVRDETPTSIPPARFAVLGCMSMGSTFCSVRSLRYVIFPIQVLAKSCKPVPVMIMGAFLGKKYPLKKYINVAIIVTGVGLFMGGGDASNKKQSPDGSPASQLTGIILLFISLCFDGATGAYEDKLMAVHSVGPFDLMYNIQLGKTILSGVALIILNQVHVFLQMVNEMGFLLIGLGLTGAMGQVFIFVTISKFGALTCSIIGLARKVTTLVASIYFYGHALNSTQSFGLTLSVASMVYNFMGKKGLKDSHGHGGGHGGGGDTKPVREEKQPMLQGEEDEDSDDADVEEGVELAEVKKPVLV